MNTDDSVESDTVSIQSYGGSETILPVNGFFVGENNESVTVVSLELPDGETDSGVTQNRVVNSFVLSIQQKMTG